MVCAAGGDNIRCAPYATFGTQELSDNAVEALKDRKACLLAHHGLIALGDSLRSAMWLAVEVENLAHQYLNCLQLGREPPLLTPEEVGERGRADRELRALFRAEVRVKSGATRRQAERFIGRGNGSECVDPEAVWQHDDGLGPTLARIRALRNGSLRSDWRTGPRTGFAHRARPIARYVAGRRTGSYAEK